MHIIRSRIFSSVAVFGDVISELLKRFVVDHSDSSSSIPDVALAQILAKNEKVLKSFDSLNHPINQKKIYNPTYPARNVVNSRIEIPSLDITLQLQILTIIRGFDTSIKDHPPKSLQCIDNAHLSSCCTGCSHKCKTCNFEHCKGGCCNNKKIKNCNHPCKNCTDTLRDCKDNSIVCCNNCKTCKKCAKCRKVDKQCRLYKLKASMETIRNLRNLIAHMTDKDCDNFEKRRERFENFARHDNWESLSSTFSHAMENILTFMGGMNDPISKNEVYKLRRELEDAINDSLPKEKYQKRITEMFALDNRLQEVEKAVYSNAQAIDVVQQVVDKIVKDTNGSSEDCEPKLIFKRLDGNACFLKLPAQLNITHILVSVNEGDWKEVQEHSFEFDDLHLFVTMKFEDGNSYRFKVIGDRMDLDQQNEEFYSEDAMYESKVACCQYSIYGVGFISYGNCLSSSPHNIIGNIEELGLQTPNKVEQEVYSSAGPSFKIDTKENWYKTCLEFLDRNYEKSCKETIQLPVDCVQDTFKSKFVNVFKDWCCSYQNAEEMGGMVISSYDAHKHAKFLGYNMKDVVKKLKLMPDNNFENRLLVYHPSFHLILNVRVLTEGGTIQLQDAMCVSCDDIKLEMLIHKDILFHSDIVLLTLLVVPNLDQLADRARFSTGTSYDMLLISYEDLSNLDSFTRKWKRSIRNHVKKMRKDHQLNTKGSQNRDIFLKMCSRIVGYMATAEAFLPSLRKMKLPVVCDNVHMQVKTVLLTSKQQEVLCSNERKIILTGSFGSGKSILGQLKMKQLYEKAEGDVKIYYVCCESQCLFQSTVQEIAEQTCLEIKKANAQIIARNLLQLKQVMGLDPSVNLSRVMKLIYERNKNILVHFVFDEYDAEDLNEIEAREIKNSIEDKSYPKIEESVIMLITQSMEKHREYIKVNQNGKERRQAHVKYQFEKTGMKTFDLPTTMRTTTRINDLIKVCVKHFEGNPSVFNHPEFLGKRHPGPRSTPKLVFSNNPINDNAANKVSGTRYYGNNPATSIPKISISLKAGKETPASLDVNSMARNPVINAPSAYALPQVKGRGDSFDAQLKGIGKQTQPVMGTKLDHKSSVANDATELTPNKELIQGPVNLDVAFKLSSANKGNSEEKTKTEFKFNGTHQVGHNIVGEWPILVSIHKNVDDSHSHREIASHYSLCLSQIAEEVIDDTEELVVLACDRESAIMVKNAFSLIKKESICYTPAFHSKDQAQSKEDILKLCRSGNCILITDFVGFMGMEAERLWVFVDKYDHFLKQHLVESLGRCTSELVVFEYDNPWKKEKPNDDIEKILQDWEQLVKKITVEAIKGQGTQELFVKLSRDKGSYGLDVISHDKRSYGLDVMSPQYKMEIDKLKKMKDESNHSTDHKAIMDTIKSNAHDPYFTTGIKDMFNRSVKASNQKVSDYSLEGFASEDSGIRLSFESRNEINGSLNYRRMILQDRFRVKIEVQNLRVCLKGSLENTERMKEWLRLYFEFKERGELNNPETFESLFFGDYFETVMEDDEIAWSCISFVPTYAFGKIIGKRGENIRRISEQFGAGIVADKEVGKIFVFGSVMAKRNVNFYFQFLMFKKNYVNSLFWSDQRIVVVGLPPHDSVKLFRRRFCKDCERNCEILPQIELAESDIHIDNIPSLKEVFSKVVNDMQIQLRKNETTACELMVHHGHIHIRNCQPGPKRVKDMISSGKVHFKNFSESSYNFNELPYENPYKDIVRYDISVFTPNQSYEMRYKVFLALKDGNVSFITYEEAGILPAKFYPCKVGPGYLCTPPQNVRRIDIVDPTTNTSTRLNFQIFQHNIVPENEIQENIAKLKSFYESLSIKSNTLYLDIGTPPEGYLLTYIRRCERKTFKLSNITLLRTSTEEIEVRDGLNCEGEIENDIFLTSKLIQGNDIVLQSAEIGLQEILTHSKKLMHNLK